MVLLNEAGSSFNVNYIAYITVFPYSFYDISYNDL